MELGTYQPRLGKIQEEPDDTEETMELDFDDSILSEYAILSDEELKKAIFGESDPPLDSIDNNYMNRNNVNNINNNNELPPYSSIYHNHRKSPEKTSLSQLRKSPSYGQRDSRNIDLEYSSSNSASSGNKSCSREEHRILEVPVSPVSECYVNEYESTSSTYNCFMNGSDSGILHTDVSSICSTTNSLCRNPSINESVNMSLNGSVAGSLFNLDQITNFSSNLPVEQRVIDFNTVIGKKLFIKAIRQKYMNIYYVLSQQRLCGDFIGNESVAAFVMILNALEIRQTELKGKYFQTHSLEDEMSFTDIAAVAKDNSLSAEVSQVFNNSSLSNFRKAIKLSCKSTNILLLCCYHMEENKKVKYSFIGGYYKDNDAVLLVTPSKSRFHARWLPILLMWNILTTKARMESTNQGHPTAGYMLLQRNETNPRIAVRINKKALLCLETPGNTKQDTQDFQRLLASWSQWLGQPATDTTDDVILQAINHVVSNVNLHRQTNVQLGIASARRIVCCKVDSLTDIVSRTKVYKAVKNQIDSLSTDNLKKLELFSEWIVSMTYSSSVKSVDKKLRSMNFKKIRRKQSPKGHSSKIIYKDNLMLAMCLVFWPYCIERRGTNSASLGQSVHSDLELFPWDILVRVQEQMRFVVTVMQYSLSECLD